MNKRTSRSLRSTEIIALSIAISFSVSCLSGPGYHPPQTDVPPAWTDEAPAAPPQAAGAVKPQPAAGPVAGPAADLTKWWRQFGDAKLTSLIEEAFQANYDLQTAQARLRQSRALRGIAAGAFWPQLTASAAYDRVHSGSGVTGVGGLAIDRDLFQAGFDAAWEIDVFGGIRQNVESAGANVRAAEENILNTRVSLASEVALLYAQIRGAQQRVLIARNNLDAQQRTVDITRKRKSVGFVSSLDVANAEAQAATTLSQIPILEKSARQSINALSVLLARPPDALLKELSDVQPLPTVSAQIPVGAPPDLLRRRPDIRQAEALLHAAAAQIGVAEAALFPNVSVAGSLAWQSGLVRDWFSQINLSWSVGPSVSWTFFAGGSKAANVHVQEAVRDQALIAYRQAILTALQDVEDALVAFSKDQESRKALSAAVTASRQASELSTQLYIQGEAEFINVLDAERTQYASEDALVMADIDLITDIIALYKALGGGWEAPDSK
ncbi:MAG: efflux transporter outer membrane subunit [Candidatus Aminicenantales bacterium]